MVSAIFEIGGWMGKRLYSFTGNTADDLIMKLENIQDLHCLVRMGRENEPARNRAQLDALADLLDKYDCGTLALADLEGLRVNLSIGAFACLGTAGDAEEAEKLLARYPEARKG